eukprot:TRINITY_DN4265_c0_g1_i1.p1 TRINITY_DN4265_c0_g1~~TRINITY_DN4265_c0_g1_i1.p1  ORF type:complete len:309 (+),score=82.50 TRINITY_DN4265_c0_g1_i1:58-927(+)
MSQRRSSSSSSSSYVSQSFNKRRSSSQSSSQSQSQEDYDDDDEIQATPRPTKRSKSSSSSSTPSSAKSSASQTQTQTQQAQISKEEREKLVGDMVRALIFYNYRRKPIDKAKLRTEVLKDYNKTHKGLFNGIFQDAQKRVADLFGFNVVNLEQGKDKVILLNNIQNVELRTSILAEGKNAATNGFLSTVLAILHLNGNKMEESLLLALMERLGLSKIHPKHPVLGDWMALIQQLTDQGYLSVNTKKGDVEKVYSFGPRIAHELDEENLKLFIRNVVAPPLRTQIPEENQ